MGQVLKLSKMGLATPHVPKELPVTMLIRNVHRVTDWRLFVQE